MTIVCVNGKWILKGKHIPSQQNAEMNADRDTTPMLTPMPLTLPIQTPMWSMIHMILIINKDFKLISHEIKITTFIQIEILC